MIRSDLIIHDHWRCTCRRCRAWRAAPRWAARRRSVVYFAGILTVVAFLGLMEGLTGGGPAPARITPAATVCTSSSVLVDGGQHTSEVRCAP